MTKEKEVTAKPSNLVDVEVGDVILIRAHKQEGGWLSVLDKVTETGAGWIACSKGTYNRWTGEGTSTGSSHGKVGQGQASIPTDLERARLGPPIASATTEHREYTESEEREREGPASQIGKNLESVKAESWMKLGLEKLQTITTWLEATRNENL